MKDTLLTASVSATAVIIGRAGSKGFPHKNAQLLAGRPLLAYSVASALQAETISRIIVSTDCPQMATTAATFAEIELVARPPELATDTATVDAAVRHAILHTADSATIVVILYANVPLRPDDLIDRAVRFLVDTAADSVQSYTPVGKYHPYWESRIDPQTGAVQPYFENKIYRRQELPPLFIPDGGVIAVRRSSLLLEVEGEPHAFLGSDRRGIKTPPGSVVDIDTPTDLLVAEAILKLRLPPTVLPARESVGAP